jgi:hypothetical protein
MLTAEQLPLSEIASFNLYPAAILGSSFQNAKIDALLDFATANYFIDAAALHANVYPTLPPTTPNDPTQYAYVKLTLANGTVTVIGIPWIIDDTLVVSQAQSIQLTINNVSPSDQNKIINALASNGFTAVSVKIITPA